MTSVKTGSFASPLVQKTQQQEPLAGKTLNGAKPPTELPQRPAQVRDGFDQGRPPVVDLTGARPAQAGGVGSTERTVTNPKLQEFLAQHPEIKTVQQLMEYCVQNNKTFKSECDELRLESKALEPVRSALLSDYMYSGPELSEKLPRKPEDADKFFLTQFKNDTYNPDGAALTTNCGPASLAMALSTAGKMPQGLTPEQRIDYARALMYPGNKDSFTFVEVGGKKIPQLNQDSVTTDIDAVTRGAQALGMGGQQGWGWPGLDDALRAGKPVVCRGHVSENWKNAFPDPSKYHKEGDGHFIAVLGRTSDGKYLVADPLNPGGVVAMPREKLALFFAGDARFAAVGA